MKKRSHVFFLFSLLVFNLFLTDAYADNSTLDMRISESTDLMDEIMQMPESSIPSKLLTNASAIAIFPSMIKGGFVFGGSFGRGVVLHFDKNTLRWSAPSFYTIAGGSWGLQIGGQAIDLILVITNERGMKGLLQDRFTIGGDAAASAGPVGRNAEAGTDLFLKASILSYSRSRGLFAGITLKGTAIMPDNKANESYYGRAVSAEDILMNEKVRPSRKAIILIDKLRKYARQRM